MKLMRQDLKKTEESGEWEVKVRRGNQQPAHKKKAKGKGRGRGSLSTPDFLKSCMY